MTLYERVPSHYDTLFIMVKPENAQKTKYHLTTQRYLLYVVNEKQKKTKQNRKPPSITNGTPKYCIMTLFHMHNFL